MNDPEFIVGEVSKNWYAGDHVPGDRRDLLCQRFEQIIAVNLERGYSLHSFQLHRIITGPEAMNETIIAVFRKTCYEVRA